MPLVPTPLEGDAPGYEQALELVRAADERLPTDRPHALKVMFEVLVRELEHLSQSAGGTQEQP